MRFVAVLRMGFTKLKHGVTMAVAFSSTKVGNTKTKPIRGKNALSDQEASVDYRLKFLLRLTKVLSGSARSRKKI